jgi:hypothetical protein
MGLLKMDVNLLLFVGKFRDRDMYYDLYSLITWSKQASWPTSSVSAFATKQQNVKHVTAENGGR